MNTKLFFLISVIGFAFFSCSGEGQLKKRVSGLLHTEVITRGNIALTQAPLTITSFIAGRSTGNIHDFYSEGDYWWPNPLSPDSAYIRRNGETNPDNFVAHRHAMIRFCTLVGDLTSAWFIDPETRMNPNLQYAQAVKGIVIGIIDTIHFSFMVVKT